MQGQIWRVAYLTTLFLILAPALAAAETPEQFYKSRGLQMVVGHEPGTGFDLYGRLLARYYGRFIPGSPNVVPENMVGGAGLVAASWLYNAAPRDGGTIATFAQTAPFDPLIGDGRGKLDGSRFTWIGSMASVIGVCGVWNNSGIEKFDDLFSKEALFGSAGAGTAGPLSQFPTALRKLLGVKIRLIQGYKGSADVHLAMARGEVQGVCGIPLSTVMTEWKDDVAQGRFKIILQLGRDKSPQLPGVPYVYDYAKTDLDRQTFDLIFGLQAIGRPFAAPPGIPPERAQALRTAFTATMSDRDFLAEAAKENLDLSPMSADKVESFVKHIYASPPAVIAKARAAVQL